MTITVKLPSELEQSLRQQCAAEGRSLSEVLRDALTAYLAATPAAPATPAPAAAPAAAPATPAPAAGPAKTDS